MISRGGAYSAFNRRRYVLALRCRTDAINLRCAIVWARLVVEGHRHHAQRLTPRRNHMDIPTPTHRRDDGVWRDMRVAVIVQVEGSLQISSQSLLTCALSIRGDATGGLNSQRVRQQLRPIRSSTKGRTRLAKAPIEGMCTPKKRHLNAEACGRTPLLHATIDGNHRCDSQALA